MQTGRMQGREEALPTLPQPDGTEGVEAWRNLYGHAAHHSPHPVQMQHPMHPRVPPLVNTSPWVQIRAIMRSNSQSPLYLAVPHPSNQHNQTVSANQQGQHAQQSQHLQNNNHHTQQIQHQIQQSQSQRKVGFQSIQGWYERSAAAFEKSKQIFDIIAKVCESPDCTQSDRDRLLSISNERMVRNLDFLAAAQAFKSSIVQEKRWSTEPRGQGFRTVAKDVKGLVESNAIDAVRPLYAMNKDGSLESKAAEVIAAESESHEMKAIAMRQQAERTAQILGIPLYSELDNFLEQAEQQYLQNGEKAGQQQQQIQPQTQMARPLCVPQSSLGGHLYGHAELPLPPILVKEGHLASTCTFDRRSHNTWNDMSPRFDGGVPNLPWVGHEEMLVGGPTMAAMTADVLDDFNSADGLLKDNEVEKASSSAKEKERVGGGTVENGEGLDEAGDRDEGGESEHRERADAVASGVRANIDADRVANDASRPSCFCGVTSERMVTAAGMAYFGCKESKCGARIPVADVPKPQSANEDSGTLIKINSEVIANSSIKKKRRRAASLPGRTEGAAKAKSSNKGGATKNKKDENEAATSPGEQLVGVMPGPAAKYPTKQPPRVPAKQRRQVQAIKTPTVQPTCISPRQSLKELIAEELASVPEELRCKKVSPDKSGRVCLRSLRVPVDGTSPRGHLGRCRYNPKKAVQSHRGASDGCGTSTSNVSSPATFSSIDPPPCSVNKSGNPTIPDPSSKADNPEECAKASPLAELSGEDEAASRKKASEALLAQSSKAYADGQDLLRREFEALSVDKIAATFGCSTNLPLAEWSKQKKEFMSQSEAIRNNPPLHASVVGKMDHIKVLPQKLWQDLASRERGGTQVYKEGASGLLATAQVAAGDPVAELLGETVSVYEAKRRNLEYESIVESEGGFALKNVVGEDRGCLTHAGRLMFRLNDDWVLDATRAGSSARFTNHSETPSCLLGVAKDPAGAVHLILQAAVDLAPGMEITL